MNNRITENDIKERLEYTNRLVASKGNATTLMTRYFNGFCHLYTESGELIVSGTKREVWDAMYVIIMSMQLLVKEEA